MFACDDEKGDWRGRRLPSASRSPPCGGIGWGRGPSGGSWGLPAWLKSRRRYFGRSACRLRERNQSDLKSGAGSFAGTYGGLLRRARGETSRLPSRRASSFVGVPLKRLAPLPPDLAGTRFDRQGQCSELGRRTFRRRRFPRAEMASLTQPLASAVGHGGRGCRAGAVAERARSTFARAQAACSARRSRCRTRLIHRRAFATS
jgi:hypothetical protein